jgi:putative amide transporter protein
MADVGLMFVGAVLFVNGLLLLGKIDGKGAATFNLFVGALQWSVLWGLFWLVLGLGMSRLTPLTRWLTLILSFTTCTIPGYLLLLGEWGHVHTWLVLLVIAATVFALLPIAGRTLRKSPGETGTPAEAGVPVSVS